MQGSEVHNTKTANSESWFGLSWLLFFLAVHRHRYRHHRRIVFIFAPLSALLKHSHCTTHTHTMNTKLRTASADTFSINSTCLRLCTWYRPNRKMRQTHIHSLEQYARKKELDLLIALPARRRSASLHLYLAKPATTAPITYESWIPGPITKPLRVSGLARIRGPRDSIIPLCACSSIRGEIQLTLIKYSTIGPIDLTAFKCFIY